MKRKKYQKKQINIPKYSVGCAQHLGKREDQQDSFGFTDINDLLLCDEMGAMAIMCDGMGGLQNGKDTSQTAVNIALEVFENKSMSENISEALIRSVFIANEQVYTMALENGVARNAGTTLVAAAIHSQQLSWVSVGDSIVYLYKDGSLKKLNKDHNYGNKLDDMVLKGSISWEEAQMSNERHHLTSYLGLEEIPEIDKSEEIIQLERNDFVLLCSDGLTNTLSRGEIRDIIYEYEEDVQKIAETLVEQTILRNEMYQDNVTVVILRMNI